ncbi:MAG: hypothetical protein WC389_06545 [Lutibacter sp.]|jgi:hypothetical protein
MKSMYIGSGDVAFLMAGTTTKTHLSLLARFCSGEIPYYNAKLSPIDACRAGAILEDRFLLSLPDNYFPQYKATSNEMDVFKCSLDFAEIENGKLKSAIELKTVWFEDIVTIEPTVEYVKKKYSKYYDQIQEQLYCTGLKEITLIFIPVYTYIDEVNQERVIEDSEKITIVISMDEDRIKEIKERAKIFQTIKDYYTKK